MTERRALAVFLMVAGLALLAAKPAAGQVATGQAAAGQPVGKAAEENKFEVRKEIYEYTSENNRDPFMTLIRPKKEVAEHGATPLESFDVSQMRLVGVVRDAKRYYALMRLPDGKHYNVFKGTPVGLHSGTVIDIRLDTVVVRQYIYDYKGRLQTEDSVLRLRKEEAK